MAVLTASGGSVMPGPRRLYTDFMSPCVAQLRGGGVPTGATGTVNDLVIGGYGDVPAVALEYCILGAGQTILSPSISAGGLLASLDLTNNEGVEYTGGITYRANRPCTFKVGTDGGFYFKLKLTIADVTGADEVAVGFRKCEAYQAAIDNYDEMAAFNVVNGDIKLETILNNGATTTTDTTNNWVDGETKTLGVHVSGAGVVTYTIDGAAPTTVAAFTFDTGEEVCAFFYLLHDTTTPGAVTLVEWDCGLQ